MSTFNNRDAQVPLEETNAYKTVYDVLLNMTIKLAKRKLASELKVKEQQPKDSDKTKKLLDKR